MSPLRVFIGMDERQPIALSVAQHSIAMNCSKPVAITPLVYRQLPLKRTGLTTFTYTRYLVPWLCNYEGHALFIDADMLCLGDIAELPWDAAESVHVVPHTSVQKHGQTVSVVFERPSVMLFNCAECKRLTPEYIETGKPQSFDWADAIGHLPAEWNHLVGYDAPKPAKLVHFTQGIPCFPETQNDEYAAEWVQAMQALSSTVPWAEIMGNSVHAKWKLQAQKPRLMYGQFPTKAG